MVDGKVRTMEYTPDYPGPFATLRDILQPDEEVPEEFFIGKESYKRWEYLKGRKRENRKAKNGYEYLYSEGGMVFPDDLNKPSRTIITGEGGASPSRFKHVVRTEKGLRRLTPVELERLNGFPDDHTRLEGITSNKRAFFMGNALVVGMIEKVGNQLVKEIQGDKVGVL